MRKILRNQSILTQTSDLTYYKSEKYSFFVMLVLAMRIIRTENIVVIK